MIQLSYLDPIETNMSEDKVCRLCFNILECNFEVIDEITREIFDVLLLKMNLDVSENPVICKQCEEIARRTVDFKSACIDTEEVIISFGAGKNDAVCLEDVYAHSRGVNYAIDEDIGICRFCMREIGKGEYVTLNTLTNDTSMVLEYMPEIDFNLVKNAVICTSCRDKLESYLDFVQNCLGVEEEIDAYCRVMDITRFGKVKLNDVLHYSFSEVINFVKNATPTGVIKQEIDTLEETKDAGIQIEENSLVVCKSELEMPLPKPSEHKCTICPYKTKRINDFKTHILSHKDPLEVEMYKCELCTHQTKYKRNLKTHMFIHNTSEAMVRKCDTCAWVTRNKYCLKKHMLKHKDIPVKMYKCEVCVYETRYKSYLNSHTLKHKDASEVETYKCALCRYESKHKKDLVKHMIKHRDPSELKMYKCDVCLKETKYKITLRRHMVIHKDVSEVETYKCGVCSYQTKHKVCLRNHKTKHMKSSEVTMHQCEICLYRSKYKNDVRRHMVVHEETKKFSCSVCTFETKYKNYLRKHVLRHKDIHKK